VIVLDASVVVHLLLNDPPARANTLRRRLGTEPLQAPHLLDVEVTHVLRRYLLSGRIPLSLANNALSNLAELRIVRHPHYPYLKRIWELRSNLTAYDATYVALAEALDAPLLTSDGRMARAGSGARIEVF
jgi:predicted nucleic acid-binding protein